MLESIYRNNADKCVFKINPHVYAYIADNFFFQLNITDITADNLHHIIDALIIHRDAMFSYELYEIVDQTNYCLDQLAQYLPDTEGVDKFYYRKQKYREPKIENLKCFLQVSAIKGAKKIKY